MFEYVTCTLCCYMRKYVFSYLFCFSKLFNLSVDSKGMVEPTMGICTILFRENTIIFSLTVYFWQTIQRRGSVRKYKLTEPVSARACRLHCFSSWDDCIKVIKDWFNPNKAIHLGVQLSLQPETTKWWVFKLSCSS